MNFEQVNQFNYSSFNQYSLFVSPTICNYGQGSNQSWFPFSTPSISPYGSPFQTTFQYSSTINSNNNTPQRDNITVQAPIGTLSVNKQHQTYPIHERKRLPKRSDQIDYNELMKTVANQNKTNRVKMCTFCKSNGEDEIIYTSHSLKNSTNKISCPKLMKYTCGKCGATGEDTHTIKYCPTMQKKLRKQLLNKVVASTKQN